MIQDRRGLEGKHAMPKITRPLEALAIILLGSAVLFARAPGAAPVAPDAVYVQAFEK
jgi:hypothetical protein